MKKTGLIVLFGLLGTLTACTMPMGTASNSTFTPSPAPTATASLTPQPTASPAPTVTPFPEARISAGEQAIFYGDYDNARDEFRISLAGSETDEVRVAALWGLGKTEFLGGNYIQALENLRQLVQTYPESEFAAQGWFLLGETYFDLQRYQESSEAFAVYLEHRPGLLDRFVQTRRGDALRALGDPNGAISAYEAAIASGVSDPTALRLEMAQAQVAAGNANEALLIYGEVEIASESDYVKAQVDLLSGQAYLRLGNSFSAYERWQHAVANYPRAYESYSALVGLVEAGQPVDDYNRGLVDYFAGQYGVALAAFERYLTSNPAHDGTVLHYKALTLREMGEYELAIAAWDEFIEKYPTHRYWADAWDEKGFTQWAYLSNYAAAGETLEKFVSGMPGSPYAVSYLMNAARVYERGGNLTKAASLWETVASQYPGDPAASNALFQAGIAHYRRADYKAAQDDFQRALVLAPPAEERARAQLWVGKTLLQLNDTSGAQTAWQAAQAIDPYGYYSLRARDLLLNRAPFQSPASYNYELDLKKERAEAAAWVRLKFDLPATTDLSNPGELSNDPRFRRGNEFWQLGLYDQARLEFEELRLAIELNPAESFRLANYLIDIGLYRPGITALRQVLTLAGLTEHPASLTAPAYFNHSRYGLYYSELIFPAAEDYGFEPIFITSLIRQESLFEGFVRSNAGAHGLMQIIPSTGASIAEQMGWPPNYTSEMLYSPQTSIRMGTFYLNNNRKYLGGDLYAALAAYNAGPGNAAIWKDLAGNDPDLQLEVIRYEETRNYIRGIYEIFTTYRSLYSPIKE